MSRLRESVLARLVHLDGPLLLRLEFAAPWCVRVDGCRMVGCAKRDVQTSPFTGQTHDLALSASAPGALVLVGERDEGVLDLGRGPLVSCRRREARPRSARPSRGR